MADWVKLSTNIFDNQKIKFVRARQNGDAVTLFWIWLISRAGTINDQGRVYFTPSKPYTPKTLAMLTGFAENIVSESLEIFQELDMIEVDEEGCINILGWEKHQNIEGLEKIKEQNRLRQQKKRQKDKDAQGIKNCVYCGAEATGVDHVIPKAKGGTDTLDNLVPCCSECNMHKMISPVADFLNQQLFEGKRVDIDRICRNEILKKHVTYDHDKKRFKNICHGEESKMSRDVTQQIREDKNREDKNREEAAAEAAAAPRDSVFTLYESEIGPLTPVIGEELRTLVKEVGEAITKQAIVEAAKSGGRSFKYIQSIAGRMHSGRDRPKAKKKNEADNAYLETLAALGVSE